MNIDKEKQEKQEKAFTEIFNIAEKAEIDFITVRDEDILYALEDQKDILAKLTPEICYELRQKIIAYISEDYAKYIAEALSAQFPEDDISFTINEEFSDTEEVQDEDETKA
jgi:hypothetical protein